MLPKIPKGIMSEKGERYIGMLIEQIDHKIELILEYIDFSEKRTNGLETRVDRVEGRLDDVELKLMDTE